MAFPPLRLLTKAADLILIAHVGWWIIAVTMLIKLLPLPKAFNLIKPLTVPRPRRTQSETNYYLAHIVEITDRLLNLNWLFFTPTCWKRAAVLFRFLTLAGVNPRIIFGAKLTNAKFARLDGHAWIEVSDVPVYEKEKPEYMPTFSYPEKGY